MVHRQKKGNSGPGVIGAETEGITIRVDKKLLHAVRKEAKEKQVSANTLISRIFNRHVDWHSRAAKAGFISVRRGTIAKLLDSVPEEEVSAIARFVATKEAKEFVLILKHEYDLSSAMDVIETWIRVSGYFFKHEVRSGTHSLVIQHDMGRKWSTYISEIYRSIFEEFGQPAPKLNITDNVVHISFEGS